MRFLFFVLTVLSFQLQAQDMWQYMTSYEGNFKVHAPGVLTEKVQTITTEVGELEYHRFFYQSPTDDAENYIYMINYVDYPLGSLHSDSLELVQTLFETSKEAALENVAGELQYADQLNFYDYPAQIWRIDYNEGNAVLKTKVFFVKNRFYLLQVATTKPKRMNQSINQFLDSFQLLNSF